jgi:hypothetical protein
MSQEVVDQPQTDLKGPPGSFFLFMQELRPVVLERYPHLKVTQLGKLMGSYWSNRISKKHKEHYTNIAATKKREWKSYLEEHPEAKRTKGMSKSSLRSRMKADPRMPKKPMTSYLFFANEQRDNVRKENPSMKLAEIGKILSKMWKELSEEDKQKYNRLAEEDKDRYEQEFDNFKKLL